MGLVKRNCDNKSCNKEYMADTRNLNRGWGLSCSKSCAATLREQAKPGYDPKRVAANNIRRVLWNYTPERKYVDNDSLSDYDPGDSEWTNQIMDTHINLTHISFILLY